MQKLLLVIAGVLAFFAVAVYGWWLLPRDHPEAPEKLAQAAIESGTAGEREIAAVRLSQQGRPAIAQLLKLLKSSNQAEVQVACIRGLGQAKCYNAIPILLRLMDDKSPMVRAQAGEATQTLLRVDYGFRADASEQDRRKVIARLRGWWATIKDSYEKKKRWYYYILQEQENEELHELTWEEL
jgi:hypothetical protein